MYYFTGSHQKDKEADADLLPNLLLALLSFYQFNFNEMAGGASPSDYNENLLIIYLAT